MWVCYHIGPHCSPYLGSPWQAAGVLEGLVAGDGEQVCVASRGEVRRTRAWDVFLAPLGVYAHRADLTIGAVSYPVPRSLYLGACLLPWLMLVNRVCLAISLGCCATAWGLLSGVSGILGGGRRGCRYRWCWRCSGRWRWSGWLVDDGFGAVGCRWLGFRLAGAGAVVGADQVRECRVTDRLGAAVQQASLGIDVLGARQQQQRPALRVAGAQLVLDQLRFRQQGRGS